MKLLAGALVLFCAAPALAHQSSVVYQDFQVSGQDLYDTVQIASLDLFEALGTKEITPSLLRERRREVYDYIAARVHVKNSDRPCAPSFDGFEVTEKTSGFFAGVRLRFACARQAEQLAIDYDLFFDLDPRHQCFARLDTGDGVLREFVFRHDQRHWDVSRPVTAWGHAWEYLQMGIGHIFTGYDHILFLVGLLVVAGHRGLRQGFVYTLKIVTAFTIAHSITLICAALGWVSVPVRISESGIALSIAYIGVENLAIGDPQNRWLLTFAFGLVHGFGFATLLREVGLPKTGLVASLVSFNIGVEIGQLCIVAMLFPLLAAFASRSVATYRRVVLQCGSGVIVALGTMWFVERAFRVTLLGGWLG
jgi:hypothetical protein